LLLEQIDEQPQAAADDSIAYPGDAWLLKI